MIKYIYPRNTWIGIYFVLSIYKDQRDRQNINSPKSTSTHTAQSQVHLLSQEIILYKAIIYSELLTKKKCLRKCILYMLRNDKPCLLFHRQFLKHLQSPKDRTIRSVVLFWVHSKYCRSIRSQRIFPTVNCVANFPALWK